MLTKHASSYFQNSFSGRVVPRHDLLHSKAGAGYPASAGFASARTIEGLNACLRQPDKAKAIGLTLDLDKLTPRASARTRN